MLPIRYLKLSHNPYRDTQGYGEWAQPISCKYDTYQLLYSVAVPHQALYKLLVLFDRAVQANRSMHRGDVSRFTGI